MARFLSTLFLAITCTWGFADCLCKSQVVGTRLSLVTLPENQTNSSIDVDSVTGKYFMVWQQNPGRIRGRLLSPLGLKIGPIQSFDEDTPTQFNRIDAFPAVVFNRLNREYLVTWASTLLDSNSNMVSLETRGQFVSSEGIPSETSFVISDPGFNLRKIIHNKNNNQYILLYSLVGSAGTQSRLFVRRLDARGTFVGSPVPVNSLPGTEVIGTDIKHDSKSNRLLVAWDGSSTSPSRVKFQILTAALQKVGGIKSISSEPSIQPRPVVVYDTLQERFLIIWKASADLKARGVDSKGIMAANINSLGKRGNRAISYNLNTGEMILAHFKNDGGLYLTRIDRSLRPVGNDFLASCQVDKRIAVAPINLVYNDVKVEFFISWPYIDASPKSWDIYGQRIRGTPSQGSCP